MNKKLLLALGTLVTSAAVGIVTIVANRYNSKKHEEVKDNFMKDLNETYIAIDDIYNEIIQRSDKEKHIWNMFTKVSSAIKRNDTATATALLNTIEIINNAEDSTVSENIQTYRIMLGDDSTAE